ncbi:MAG: hypothetical protein ACI379_14805 [Nocardioides sp.]|uniref:hypothetical protein n=1 Tax=Nocardioides sp. TaxID=35761 RepID=UPI003F0BA7A8
MSEQPPWGTTGPASEPPVPPGQQPGAGPVPPGSGYAPPGGYPPPANQPYPGQPYPGQPYPGHPHPGQFVPPAGAPWQPTLPVAAHKPGAVPLRPLTLGDMWSAAVKVVRVNPRATVGASVLVAAVAMVLPVLATAVLTWGTSLTFDPAADDLSGNELLGALGMYGSLLVGAALQSLGLVLVTGMIAHVVHAAALGRRMSLAQAWQATLGRRWRLIGLVTLVSVVSVAALLLYVGLWALLLYTLDLAPAVTIGLVTLPFFLAAMAWVWVRVLLLPVPVLMIERTGVFAAIGRGYRLTAGQFWRTLGIALVTSLVVQTAASMLATPFTIAGTLVGFFSVEYAMLGYMLGQAVGTVIVAAITYPFTSSVTTLQYLDQRIRKEGYDLDLFEASGGGAPR